jgi:hypothetical protein
MKPDETSQKNFGIYFSPPLPGDCNIRIATQSIKRLPRSNLMVLVLVRELQLIIVLQSELQLIIVLQIQKQYNIALQYCN